MEASSVSQAFNTRRLTRSQVRASSSPSSSRRALADVTNDSPSRKQSTPYPKHHPNPSSNLNPNPNPNPNPEPVLNSNPNPNPNPSPNPSSNPNSNLNPNPNPDPNLNSNPYPNSNPSSNSNPIPNPSLSPNPNPDPNLDLSLYSNPNPGGEEELQTHVKKAVENSSNTKCLEPLADSVNPSSSPSPNLGQSLSTGREEEVGGKDGLQRAAEKTCYDSYDPPVVAVKQSEDCIEKCAASSARRLTERPQISGFEHDDDDSDDGSDWSVLVNTPSLQGDTDPDKSPPPTIPNRLILMRHCHRDYETLTNSSYCYYHLHKTASEQSSNTVKHNNNTNNTNNGEEYADSGTFYGLHKEEQEKAEVNDDDDYYEELCRGMKGVSVEEYEEDKEYEEEEEEEDVSNNPWMVRVSKPLPEHKGKHIRFVYSGDGEEIVEEECAFSASSSSRERSPGVLCLRGLPAPIGKHLRFTEEEEEKGEEIQRVQ